MGRHQRSKAAGVTGLMFGVMWLGLTGCYRGTKLVTVTFTDRADSSEYWVCSARADGQPEECRGQLDGDVEPTDYTPDMDVLARPAQCPDGVAKMEIVVRRQKVLRVGYTCALPALPTGTPRTGGDGSADGAGSLPTGLPSVDPPTGLPTSGEVAP